MLGHFVYTMSNNGTLRYMYDDIFDSYGIESSPDRYEDINIGYVRGDGDVRYDKWSEMSYSYGMIAAPEW